MCKYGDTAIPLSHDAACHYSLTKVMADHSHANVKQDEWPLRHKGVSHVYSSFCYRQSTAHVAGIMRGSKTTGIYFSKTGFAFEMYMS